MELVIAEKPSVAREIANVFGNSKREDGYIKTDKYYITWCVGHLIQLSMPEVYNENLKKWTIESLPFMPSKFLTEVSKNTKNQFNIIKQLIKREDVTSVICATDAGREGELIFRLVYEKINVKKPVKRLWISSLERESIINGFAKLKDGEVYNNLYKSALARTQADFLVGINFTRLYSVMYNDNFSVGRVQTPTINIITERCKARENYKPKKYIMLEAYNEDFKASLRIDDIGLLNNIMEECKDSKAVVTSLVKQEKSIKPPKLFNLNDLQIEANKILGYTSQQTLDIAQSLYESKLITYPRTDSNFLTGDMQSSFKSIIELIFAEELIITDSEFIREMAKDVENVINDNKVSDHHAIIIEYSRKVMIKKQICLWRKK